MEDFPNGYFYITSRFSRKVIDVDGASTKNDGKILIWTSKHNDDRDNQLWRYQDGFILNKCSGKVLDVRGESFVDNALLCQYDRKPTSEAKNQRWGYEQGYIHVLSDRNMVLDVQGGQTKDGTRVILYRKKFDYDSANQLWDLIPAGEVRAEREVLFKADFE